MSVVDPSLLASEDRPIELRFRTDLVLEKAWYQSERSWIVKDPLALQYSRLREPEYRAFLMLDGKHSLGDIQAELTRLFPERVTRLADVQQLVTSLNQQGLLISVSPGRGQSLIDRSNKQKRQKATKLLSSALSLRLPGMDPEPILRRVYPLTRWFFTRWCTAFCLLVSVAAIALILGNLDEFLRRLPQSNQFFALQNLLAMAALLFVTKSIHELGHGLFCKHFGGECHEIGFMFLVLTPAMYCDTSDSWRLPNKWHRMAIGAAGMYVEILMAAVFTFIWWYTNPGWLHYLALNVMFICSVSTILFNANPLLRYDGYYILADWLEVPNLSQKSRSALLSQLRVHCLGMEPVPDRSLPQQNLGLFALYSILSVVYRWFVLIMILWFLSEIFEPYGLQSLGHVLIGISLVGLVGIPMWKLFQFFSYPGRLRQVKKPQLLVTLSALIILIVGVFTVPIDYHVHVNFVVQPRDAQRVHVSLPGMIRTVSVRPGETVSKGQLLAQLENASEQVRLAKLQGQRAKLRNEIAQLNRLVGSAALAPSMIVTKQVELQGVERQLRLQNDRLAMLDLRADRDGVVVPPPNVERPPLENTQLAIWSGTPFEAENQGAFLEKDTWFCSVAKQGKWEAVLTVEQSDIGLIAIDQPVQFMLSEAPGTWLQGQLTTLSQNKIQQLPRELGNAAKGPLSDSEPSVGGPAPIFDFYQATASIESADLQLAQGFRGKAKIYVGKRTIAWRLGRFFNTVFNFS